jgi:Family of unknown function (DUF6527)
MTLPSEIRFEFVESVPSEREQGVFYISMPYRSIIHNCLCGCGAKIVTPIRPDKWTLFYDGDTITIDPSIGNWSYPCQSHYVIRRNRVLDAGPMSQSRIDAGRRRDFHLTDAYYNRQPAPERDRAASLARSTPPPVAPKRKNLWDRLMGR